MNIFDWQRMKDANNKISMVTCYDYWSAKIIAETSIDSVLIGDSAAMVMHGNATTISAHVEMLAQHTAAVAKAINKQFIVADLPFLSYRKDLSASVEAVACLMQAGAQAIKLEGPNNEVLITHLTHAGVPVMGHLGLTPQSVHQLGGFRPQGMTDESAQKIYQQALAMEKAGCFSLVLECIPKDLAAKITQALKIPTIGIGAGPDTDGQVLVLQDLLGMDAEFKPKLLKTYLNGFQLIQQALNNYSTEVKQKIFPGSEHCYSVSNNTSKAVKLKNVTTTL